MNKRSQIRKLFWKAALLSSLVCHRKYDFVPYCRNCPFCFPPAFLFLIRVYSSPLFPKMSRVNFLLCFLFHDRNVFIGWFKIILIVKSVIFHEDSFHYLWNLAFLRFKQYDQILHGTVSGTNIHFTYLLMYGLFHTVQRPFDPLHICILFRRCIQRNHNQITVISISFAQTVHVFINFGKSSEIQIKRTSLLSAFL